MVWGKRLAVSLNENVWVGERDCEAGLPYGTGEDGITGECSGLGLSEGDVKGDSGDREQGEWNGRPGLWGPGEMGDMGPGE